LRKWARRHWAAVWAAAVCLLVTLVALGGSGGWVLSDRSSRQDKAREALEAAGPGLREGNPHDPALVAAAQRAEAQLSALMLGEELRRRVEQLQKDIQMLAELERIRLDQTGIRDGRFDKTSADPQYVKAFREYGVNVETLGPAEVAATVQKSAIREHLAAGLDGWADALADYDNEESRQRARQLLAVARQVDPDEWRNRLRDMVLSRDPKDLEQLELSAPVEDFSPPTLGLLGEFVADRRPVSEREVGLLRRGQQRFPADFWANMHLAWALTQTQPPLLEEAIGFFRACVALRPRSAGARLNLGAALKAKGDVSGAIAEFRESIRLMPDCAAAHHDLGIALLDKDQLEEAIAECREACRLKSQVADGHLNLGNALWRKGRLDEAIAEYHEAIGLKPDDAGLHAGLGNALVDKGQLDEAIAECREAFRLNPPEGRALAHNNLSMALWCNGQRDEAIAECREAIRLKPNLALAHNNLGVYLCEQGKPVEAEAAFRKALELKPDWAQVHSNLGTALVRQGKLTEAVATCRKAIELQRDCAEAYYNGACASALAGCGQGEDAAKLGNQERSRFRRQALDWLRVNLAAYRRLLEKEPDKAGPPVREQMQHWQQDTDFAGVRGQDALAKLPEAERQQWQKLWADVADLLARATAEKKSNTK
jgi:tetratricopeptide (TPR) repeat protein